MLVVLTAVVVVLLVIKGLGWCGKYLEQMGDEYPPVD